jgi:hypothetical protein
MPILKSERSANQIFTRTQLWQCGVGDVLVIFSMDEARCFVFLNEAPRGISPESLFEELELAYRPGFSLVPAIDGHAIGCFSEEVDGLLDTLSDRMA